MWKARKPKHDAIHTLRECANRQIAVSLSARITASESAVVDAEKRYVAAVCSCLLHTLKPEDFVLGQVSSHEMKNLYENGMVNKDAPGRVIYDSLVSAAPRGICPLCNQRPANTLDHHLPKSKFSALAVVPTNLVPSCFECNKTKRAKQAESADQESFHPYFDDVDDDVWLTARIVHTFPPAVKFEVSAPPHWSADLTARVQTHFNTFELGQLYSLYAASHLSGAKLEWIWEWNASGPGGLQMYLLRQSRSHSAGNQNGWLGAMLLALAYDQWFCTTGVSY